MLPPASRLHFSIGAAPSPNWAVDETVPGRRIGLGLRAAVLSDPLARSSSTSHENVPDPVRLQASRSSTTSFASVAATSPVESWGGAAKVSSAIRSVLKLCPHGSASAIQREETGEQSGPGAHGPVLGATEQEPDPPWP